MAVREAPSWLQNGSHSSEDDRLLLQSLRGGSPNQAITQGVVAAADMAVTQNGTPNMTVNVASGAAFIAGTESSMQGVYNVVNDASLSVTISTANASNPRIDLIVAQVLDDQYSGASHIGQIIAVAGTPASSPSAPATPKNSIVLAQVLVGASVTSIVTANITDERLFSNKSPRFIATATFTQGSSGSASQIGGTVTTWTASESIGGAWTATSTGWTVPRPGLYLPSAQTEGASALAGHSLVLTKNGSALPVSGPLTVTAQQLSALGWAECAAGDILGVKLGQNSGGSVTINAAFAAVLVRDA